MKLAVLTTAFVLALSMPAAAFLGQPIGDDAVGTPGITTLTGSITLESDLSLFGVRAGYGVTDDLKLFVGAGLADLDGFSTDPYIQGGGILGLPVDLPVDLAIRGSLGMARFSRRSVDFDVVGLNGGVLASLPLDLNFTVYGYGGLAFTYSKVSGGRGFGSSSDTDIDPAIAAGALFALDDAISFFGELAHIDELFISLGGRFKF